MIAIGYTLAMVTLTTILVVSLVAEITLALLEPRKVNIKPAVSYAYTTAYA